jgi:hypothetical protein
MIKKYLPIKPKSVDRKTTKIKKNKKISLFYKIHLSIALIISLALIYFLILVSTEPKSIPIVTQKIEKILEKKFGNDVGISNTYISFTGYGTLKIAVLGLKILHTPSNNNQNQAFVIPKLEAEFSLLDALLMRFFPSKIKIIDPTITLNSQQSQLKETLVVKNNDAVFLTNFLSEVQIGKFPIKNFEIENAKLLIKGEERETKILVKKSQIRNSLSGKNLYFSSSNKVSFDIQKSDVDFDANCQFSKNSGLKCDLALENFIPNSISNLNSNLGALSQINAILSAKASFLIKDGKIGDISFKANAAKGDFEFLEFFSQKISFLNLQVIGKYNHQDGLLNLSEIKTDFASEVNSNPHLQMSLAIFGLNNQETKKLDFKINLQDVPNLQMEKFWPSALSHNNIRKWVISHIKNGVIKNAYANFSLTKNSTGNHLNNIDSQVNFEGFDLEYSSDFPVISKVAGVAQFSMKGMKIELKSGDVLNSKILHGLVEIDDFGANQVLLKISGKSQGSASDSLKHANNSNSSFSAAVEKYLNGDSQNSFDIRIPLNEKITLEDSYIEVNSTVTKLENPYVKGDLTIFSKKNFGSQNFDTKINLTQSSLLLKDFNIEKKSQIESGLDFIVRFEDNKNLALKNILLWKKEGKNLAKISGEMKFETSPFWVSEINLKNSNFGKNNYQISYISNSKNLSQSLSIKGKSLDLSSAIQQKSFANSGGKKFVNSQVQIKIENLNLLHFKSLKNLSLFLSCKNNFCKTASIAANYGKKQFINLSSKKSSNENLVEISGQVSDVGYLAEAFGISNTVLDGDAKLKLVHQIVAKKPVLAGEIFINDDITIFENASTKKLASNSLFLKIKDKIFSSQKIIFNSVKIDFFLQNRVLNLKSLVANNYKIGITAKGEIDLNSGLYNIKGMIVPGFVINNLFGIGKIPILGNLVSGLLTGGEGGGVFGIRYQYFKNQGDKEATFKTNKISSFVPTTIKNLFDLLD